MIGILRERTAREVRYALLQSRSQHHHNSRQNGRVGSLRKPCRLVNKTVGFKKVLANGSSFHALTESRRADAVKEGATVRKHHASDVCHVAEKNNLLLNL